MSSLKFKEHIKKRTIFLLPNALTTASLFCGFFSLIRAIHADFRTAATAIFFSLIFDSLDGRVARLTRTQSVFGAEYDSLSDLLAFGVAPAILMYQFSLHLLGKIGWAIAFIYCVTTALRLARFNSTIDIIDKRYFQGLPSPAAAALMASFILTFQDETLSLWLRALPIPNLLSWVSACISLLAGLSMVSDVLYISGKGINMKKNVRFSTIVWLAIVITLFSQITSSIAQSIFSLSLIYLLSGYFYAAYRYFMTYRHKKLDKNQQIRINASQKH